MCQRRNSRHDDHRAWWFSVHMHLLLQHFYIYIYYLTSCSRSFIIISLIFCRSYFVIVVTFVCHIINFIFISFTKKTQFSLNFRTRRSSHIGQGLSYYELIFVIYMQSCKIERRLSSFCTILSLGYVLQSVMLFVYILMYMPHSSIFLTCRSNNICYTTFPTALFRVFVLHSHAQN